ncbi:methyltransferase family protein [Rhodoplanes roseus]|uniref:Isoprenylcysteine carboxyl methyltransferase n=1 Tax=Rhodoplanes roseus TaxID=29409 RepID=A0A327L363_9BRAD|nr:isoprenylcysteine carboxylmethyltransferase family protein [Rhodoplanes roseus]RAI44941.1 hypothetical protein CH341_06560 [Rhodoplanes roseus]
MADRRDRGSGEDGTADLPDKSGVVAPPPVIAVATLAIAAALESAWPIGLRLDVGLGLRLVVAALLAAAGVALAVAGERRFAKAGTDPLPWRPASALVTTGIYRFMRNPMYVGLILLMLGIAVGFASLWLLVLLPACALLLHAGVVVREERYLERKFGDDYRRFVARVPRYGWPRR